MPPRKRQGASQAYTFALPSENPQQTANHTVYAVTGSHEKKNAESGVLRNYRSPNYADRFARACYRRTYDDGPVVRSAPAGGTELAAMTAESPFIYIEERKTNVAGHKADEPSDMEEDEEEEEEEVEEEEEEVEEDSDGGDSGEEEEDPMDGDSDVGENVEGGDECGSDEEEEGYRDEDESSDDEKEEEEGSGENSEEDEYDKDEKEENLGSDSDHENLQTVWIVTKSNTQGEKVNGEILGVYATYKAAKKTKSKYREQHGVQVGKLLEIVGKEVEYDSD